MFSCTIRHCSPVMDCISAKPLLCRVNVCHLFSNIYILVSPCHIELIRTDAMRILGRWNHSFLFLTVLHLPSPQSLSPLVTESSCCVYYMAPPGAWWLRRKPQLRPQSRGPRCPGSLCRSEPSWPPDRRTGPGPKGPPETTLRPKPGMNQILHQGNPGGKKCC